MKIKQHTIIMILFAFLSIPVSALQAQSSPTQSYPSSYITFRDTVYMQNSSLTNTMRLYATAKQDIESLLSGVNMYLALARCEYLMGITFKTEGRDSESAAFFEQGIAWSENSIGIRPTSEGYMLLGSGISFLCEVRTAYGIRNHGKILENGRRALELDPNNLTAQYLIASYYIAAPWPITDLRRGATMLEEILNHRNFSTLGRDDQFNLYLMLQLVCLKQKKTQEAQMWRERGAALYPTNNFISLLTK